MPTRTASRTLLNLAGLIVGWSWLIAPQCDDGSGGTGPVNPPPIQNCKTRYDTDFPIGGTVTLNKGAVCPIKVPNMTRVPYAATANLPGSGNLVYGLFEAAVSTRTGGTSSITTNAVWSMGNGRYFVNVTGDYYAAAGGFDGYFQGRDSVHNRFYIGAGRWTTGTITIEYLLGNPSNFVVAPSQVDPGQTYSVTATTDDPLLVTPITWDLYVDQQLMATSGSPEFTVQAGAPSTVQEVRVMATDVYGRAAYGTTHVGTRSQCVDEYGNPVQNCQ